MLPGARRDPLHVVVATPDAIGVRMAGPGIRALYLARELAAVASVTLVARRGEPELEVAEFFRGASGPLPRLVERGTPAAVRALREADVLFGQPARGFRRYRRGQKIVYDLFDPLVLELRELYGTSPSLRQLVHLAAEWSRLTFALRHADLLVCAAPKQREFYGRLQPGETGWIEVPFGVDLDEAGPAAVPSAHTPSASARENLVLWGGGVWEWLDPATAVEAITALNREGLRCRLLFLGRTRPNQEDAGRGREARFDALLASGAPFVDANPQWVPYRERLTWLRAAKVTIMLHRATAEAECAIRTRLFDALVAGVPVVATEGGFAADLVRREGLGIVVPPGDRGAVAGAIRRLLCDDEFHLRCVRNLERVRPQYAWSRVARPLVEAVEEWERQRL